MRPLNHPIKTILALTLALGAVAPAAAPARPAQDLRALAKTSSLAGTTSSTRTVTASSPRGFDWGDAGIGAAGGLGLSMVAAGGTLVITRRRRHRRYATSR
jgi:hypothetical protein